MSSENGWIPWDEREGVKKYVVKCIEEYDDNDNEIYSLSYIGAVSDVYIQEFKEFVGEASDNECYYQGYDLLLFEELNEQDKKEVLDCYIQSRYEIDDNPFRLFKRVLELKDKDCFELLHKKAVLSNNNSPAVPASAPADETSRGRTVIDEKLKFEIINYIRENPNCSNRDITKNFGMGTGTISSNPDLKKLVKQCRELNIQSMENNPNFDNDPFSNGRGRKNE